MHKIYSGEKYTSESELLRIAKRFIQIEGHLECPVFERDIADSVADLMQSEGINCEKYEIAKDRWNVKAVLNGSSGGKTLILNTHLDTVPAYQMKNPFVAKEKDGLLYGRGSVDPRAGLACLCYAMIAVKRANIPLRGDVMLVATCDEESGSIGARAALANLSADAAIICEATDLAVGVAHKGVEWFQVDFEGVATHSGTPQNGENAIYKATSFVGALLRYIEEELASQEHPLIGRPTLNVGIIEGGNKTTVVPNHCKVCFDNRWLPGKTRADIIVELKKILSSPLLKFKGKEPEMKLLLGNETNEFPPLETPAGHFLTDIACKAVTEVLGGEQSPVGVPYWTEAALFQNIAGIPAVVLGPGNIKQAHSNDEFVPIDQIINAWKIYTEAIMLFCM